MCSEPQSIVGSTAEMVAEVANMFWGVTLDGGKRYTQTVECSFHISMAAIEINTKENEKINRVSVMIAHEKAEFLMCTLDNKHVYQQPLDLNFSEGEEVTFFLNGQGVVHLTGYLVPEEGPEDDDFSGQLGDEMSDLEEESEDDSSEETDEDEDGEEVPELLEARGVGQSPGKRKKKTPPRESKKQKKELLINDSDDDDEESDESFDPDMFAEMDSDLDSEDEDESEEDMEESDEDDEGDRPDMSGSFLEQGKKKKNGMPAKTEKIEKGTSKVTGTPGKTEKREKNTPNLSAKKGEKDISALEKKRQMKNAPLKKQNAEGKMDNPQATGKNTPLKKQNAEGKLDTPQATGKNTPLKKQNAEGKLDTPQATGKKEEATANGTTPDSEKKKKKKKKKKGNDQSGTPAASPQSSKPRKLAGGIVIQDAKEGHGPEAKPGKMVSLYYTGRLENGKPFDSCTSGKPFKFRLGKQEVIKGWDIGIADMKVGGKRKLTVPPGQAYGSSRTGPIPPNSTLIFDVELKAVS